ncbi:D-alanyl-D-alanine carboxypeptidase family protein [Neptunomonas sp.]|uniref:D-alanyl-D-alanine carboxypeptidase family protein n=1 Tax=Neptunomonas sp. TaxID=1971898 RepID=UPI0025D33910|nr:D-alanyl-D-alanine carboxypeptidase family protein [Neptunomonas sp.]
MRQILFSMLLCMCCGASQSLQAGMPYIVVEAQSGTVIKQLDADVPWYPASLTKMMTLYLAFQSIKKHDLSLNTLLKVSARAQVQPAMKLGVLKGEKITVRKAIIALATVSSNDVAVVLAEGISGTEKKFAEEMSAQARRMGMRDSMFTNATGLPDASQVSSARDLAILARRLLLDFPEYYYFFSNRSFQYKGESFVSHNRFLNTYPGADGFKTGYTCGSGYNLVASARKRDNRLIVVLLGAQSGKQRGDKVKELMDQGFKINPDAPGLTLLALRGSVSARLSAPAVLKGSHCQPL